RAKRAEGGVDDLIGSLSDSVGNDRLAESGAAEEFGGGGTGANRENRDAVVSQIFAQAEAPVEKKRFAGAVSGHVGSRLEGGGGGDIDDETTAFAQQREEKSGEVNGSFHVDLDHVEMLLEIGIRERAVAAET